MNIVTKIEQGFLIKTSEAWVYFQRGHPTLATESDLDDKEKIMIKLCEHILDEENRH